MTETGEEFKKILWTCIHNRPNTWYHETTDILEDIISDLKYQGFCISRWRPIKELEKDGREVLVACKEVEGEVHGIGENPCGIALVNAGSALSADMPFYMTHGDCYCVEAVNPTHFMPLPTPPKGGE